MTYAIDVETREEQDGTSSAQLVKDGQPEGGRHHAGTELAAVDEAFKFWIRSRWHERNPSAQP